jgi:elongation factor Ts
MTNITAGLVAELRKITGLGMMECKKALVESNGDLQKAEEVLRIKNGNKISKLSGRAATEGVVFIESSADNKHLVMLEVNCETDFVAKDANFVNFVKAVAKAILADTKVTEIEQVKSLTIDGVSYEQCLANVLAKLGENISIRRLCRLDVDSGVVSGYVHSGKIGVMVHISENNMELGKDIALHIAANKPLCLDKHGIDADLLERETRIYTEQAKSSGKPAEIIAKMVEGRISKYIAENTLLGQSFVKNQDLTIEALLKQHNAQVNKFTMFVLGEGLEKKEENFAAEVANMMK